MGLLRAQNRFLHPLHLPGAPVRPEEFPGVHPHHQRVGDFLQVLKLLPGQVAGASKAAQQFFLDRLFLVLKQVAGQGRREGTGVNGRNLKPAGRAAGGNGLNVPHGAGIHHDDSVLLRGLQQLLQQLPGALQHLFQTDVTHAVSGLLPDDLRHSRRMYRRRRVLGHLRHLQGNLVYQQNVPDAGAPRSGKGGHHNCPVILSQIVQDAVDLRSHISPQRRVHPLAVQNRFASGKQRGRLLHPGVCLRPTDPSAVGANAQHVVILKLLHMIRFQDGPHLEAVLRQYGSGVIGSGQIIRYNDCVYHSKPPQEIILHFSSYKLHGPVSMFIGTF